MGIERPHISRPLRPLPLASSDRRRFHRVRVHLSGRLMLADRREFPCSTQDISPGGLAISADVRPDVGQVVIVYLEILGRIEGVVTRHFSDGFAMTIQASAARREKFAAQLTWLANRADVDDSNRKHDRIVPTRRAVSVVDAIGRKVPGTIIDVSRSGAAIRVAGRYAPQQMVRIGNTKAQVVRLLEDGIAVTFLLPIPIELFDADIEL